MSTVPDVWRRAAKADAETRAKTFGTLHKEVTLASERAQAILWAVQLEEFPDSVRVFENEVHSWSWEEPDYEEWYSGRPGLVDLAPTQVGEAWSSYLAYFQLNIARCIAIASAETVGVFYRCGKREDGTYSWRGYRYGVEGSQYQSGFGT